jgi:hypothetical protein
VGRHTVFRVTGCTPVFEWKEKLKPLVYLLIDFENVKPPASEVAQIRGDEFRLWIFRGPHQNKFDADIVEVWQPLGDHVKFIQSAKAGKNALDFHIAFCLGLVHRENAAAQRPARYIVVSKDGGFDALFEYARTEGCNVMKAVTILDALSMAASPASSSSPPTANSPKPAAQKAQPAATAKKTAKAAMPKRTTPNADDAEMVVVFLRAQSTNRPSKRSTLEHHVIHILGNGVTEDVARAVVDQLEREQFLSIVNNKIEYRLSKKL